MPSKIEKLARRHLSDPINIRIAREVAEPGSAPKVRQSAYVVPRSHKPAALGRILDVESPAAAIVFCRTRHEVDQLSETLNGRGYRAEALHGGMSQEARDRVMGRVRAGTAELLIATDVAARGLDIDQLTHVVNYDVPSAPEAYVHRIGRVGRAGREGVAITLAEPREHRLVENIQRVTGQKIAFEKVPTIADLRNRRMELTLATLRESLIDDELDRYRTIVETLTDEFDLVEIALAAVKLAHEAVGGDEDETEIPEIAPRKQSGTYEDRGKSGKSFKDGKDGKGGKFGKEGKGSKGDKGERLSKGDAVRLYFPIGRSAHVRPGDLVGAIAGETSLSGKDIGAIEITENLSLVEVPGKSVEEVIGAMKRTTIKGLKITPRRERF
jgi:ATP-dependent RNA helicase DeaD